MSKFKRVSLIGSEELFRETRPRVVDDDDDTLTEVVERRPRQAPPLQQFEFTAEEIDLLLEAIQTAKYPERAKGKLPLDRFERYDALRDRLQGRT